MSTPAAFVAGVLPPSHGARDLRGRYATASLGFTGARIRTLETGCEINVHFVDDATAEVGFNDYVYTLKKR